MSPSKYPLTDDSGSQIGPAEIGTYHAIRTDELHKVIRLVDGNTFKVYVCCHGFQVPIRFFRISQITGLDGGEVQRCLSSLDRLGYSVAVEEGN